MASYSRGEAREWAREHLRGVVNVIIPSFTSDLQGINEAAVRHDVRKQLEYGFAGALLVSEVSITQPEYREFCEIAQDEAKGRQIFVHHSSWSDLDAGARGAEDCRGDRRRVCAALVSAELLPRQRAGHLRLHEGDLRCDEARA